MVVRHCIARGHFGKNRNSGPQKRDWLRFACHSPAQRSRVPICLSACHCERTKRRGNLLFCLSFQAQRHDAAICSSALPYHALAYPQKLLCPQRRVSLHGPLYPQGPAKIEGTVHTFTVPSISDLLDLNAVLWRSGRQTICNLQSQICNPAPLTVSPRTSTGGPMPGPARIPPRAPPRWARQRSGRCALPARAR